jgi:tetratricopeptide (TPR) repeat protein
MVFSVPLQHLSLLVGEDVSKLPKAELIQRVKELFGFLGEIEEIEVRDDTVAIRVREQSPKKTTESEKLAQRAAKRAQDGDYARAVDLLRRALQINPTLPSAHRDLAMALMELGKHAEAKDALIDALKLDSNDAWSFVVLANLYAKHEDNHTVARRFYERALEIKPGDAWALNGLAAALTELGDTQGAHQRFDEAIRSNPEFANAWLGKAMLQLRAREVRESAETIRTMFARAKVQDARSEPVFAEAAKVFLSAEADLAQAEESEAFKTVEDYLRTVEQESGYPVEISDEDLPAQIAGRAQIAWKHGRDRHRIAVRRGLPPPIRDTLSHMNLHTFVWRLRLVASAGIVSSRPPQPVVRARFDR